MSTLFLKYIFTFPLTPMLASGKVLSKMKTFCLGHRNFGMLTTMVPHQNYKHYQSMILAEKDCDEIRKRNPQMKVLVCTPLGMPVRVAKDSDRQ